MYNSSIGGIFTVQLQLQMSSILRFSSKFWRAVSLWKPLLHSVLFTARWHRVKKILLYLVFFTLWRRSHLTHGEQSVVCRISCDRYWLCCLFVCSYTLFSSLWSYIFVPLVCAKNQWTGHNERANYQFTVRYKRC